MCVKVQTINYNYLGEIVLVPIRHCTLRVEIIVLVDFYPTVEKIAC